MDVNSVAYAVVLFVSVVGWIIYLRIVDRKMDKQQRELEEIQRRITEEDREWLASWGSRWDDDD